MSIGWIFLALWLSFGVTRYIMMRQSMIAYYEVMPKFYTEMGLTDEQIDEAGFLRGMHISKYLIPISDLSIGPLYLLRDGLAFFRPIRRETALAAAVDTFRRTIYADGRYVEMLEVYEAQMRREITNPTEH